MSNQTHRHEPEARDTRLRCPKDSTLMEKVTVRGEIETKRAEVTVDRCALCGALWLDRHELDVLISMKAASQVDVGPFSTNRQNPRAQSLSAD
jgi:Zn-finger nucleic acid-binding protein